ncbi:hypothetical protein [Saliphagus infecundisoli]|uniref:Integral membrane protein n=1 Tax=Saliphagus infecundisoli TaxID=1849069 RepID=A0ABD5QJY7_9EURY|nr:hypothetical protein [Saliphagus infecundisoli]
MNTNNTTRQYGAAIALISGLYSLLAVIGGSGMMGSNSGLLMAFLGVVIVVHGVVLLTPYADRLGNASGPLMIGYSVLMLLNQILVGVTGSANWGMGMGGGMESGMNGGMGDSMGSTVTAGMGWDLGMVALAVLMLISGLIMTNRRTNDSGM